MAASVNVLVDDSQNNNHLSVVSHNQSSRNTLFVDNESSKQVRSKKISSENPSTQLQSMIDFLRSPNKDRVNPFENLDENLELLKLLDVKKEDLPEFFIKNFLQYVMFCFEYITIHLDYRFGGEQMYRQIYENAKYRFFLNDCDMSYNDFLNDEQKCQALSSRVDKVVQRNLLVVSVILKTCINKEAKELDFIYGNMCRLIVTHCSFINKNSYPSCIIPAGKLLYFLQECGPDVYKKLSKEGFEKNGLDFIKNITFACFLFFSMEYGSNLLRDEKLKIVGKILGVMAQCVASKASKEDSQLLLEVDGFCHRKDVTIPQAVVFLIKNTMLA